MRGGAIFTTAGMPLSSLLSWPGNGTHSNRILPLLLKEYHLAHRLSLQSLMKCRGFLRAAILHESVCAGRRLSAQEVNLKQYWPAGSHFPSVWLETTSADNKAAAATPARLPYHPPTMPAAWSIQEGKTWPFDRSHFVARANACSRGATCPSDRPTELLSALQTLLARQRKSAI